MLSKRKLRSEKGSIVVEAAMAVPIFMFAIVTILSLVEICAAQTLITNTVNGVAKDFSKYSYLYCKLGAYGLQSNIANKGADADGIAVAALSVDNIGEVMPFIEDSIGVINESENFGESLCYMLLNGALEAAIDGVGGGIIDMIADKRIGSDEITAQELFDHYGIENLVWHFRFDTTTNQIIVVADYDVRVMQLLDIDYVFHFIKTTKTMVWTTDVKYASSDEGGE